MSYLAIFVRVLLSRPETLVGPGISVRRNLGQVIRNLEGGHWLFKCNNAIDGLL